jgi:hypothetical protein
MEFMPERWEGVRLNGLNGKIDFLPFGLGDLSCPAKKAAPMTIEVLVGALMGGVDAGWELVDGKVRGDVLGNKVLDGEREAYTRLLLRKIER